MTDVDLIDMLATRIEEGLATYSRADLSAVPVQKKYQPTQQGIPTGDQIWFNLLFSVPFGWSMRKSEFVNDESQFVNGKFKDIEDQIYATRFQISGLFPEVPGDPEKPTANDVLTYLARFITHKANLRDWFKKHQASVYRIDMNNNEKFYDDMSQFESFPSFDLVILHRNAISIDTPAVARAVNNDLGDVPV